MWDSHISIFLSKWYLYGVWTIISLSGHRSLRLGRRQRKKQEEASVRARGRRPETIRVCFESRHFIPNWDQHVTFHYKESTRSEIFLKLCFFYSLKIRANCFTDTPLCLCVRIGLLYGPFQFQLWSLAIKQSWRKCRALQINRQERKRSVKLRRSSFNLTVPFGEWTMSTAFINSYFTGGGFCGGRRCVFYRPTLTKTKCLTVKRAPD